MTTILIQCFDTNLSWLSGKNVVSNTAHPQQYCWNVERIIQSFHYSLPRLMIISSMLAFKYPVSPMLVASPVNCPMSPMLAVSPVNYIPLLFPVMLAQSTIHPNVCRLLSFHFWCPEEWHEEVVAAP